MGIPFTNTNTSSMDVQGVSISAASSVDVQGVSHGRLNYKDTASYMSDSLKLILTTTYSR